MHKLSATELLSVWEEGQGRSPIQQALLLLAATCPAVSVDDLAAFSIGRRDGLLLQLQAWLFGSQIVSLARCPQCGETAELTFDVADIQMPFNSLETDPENHAPLPIAVGEYQITARPINSLDLLAIASESDPVRLRTILLTRCLLAIHRGDVEHSTDDLPEAALTAVEEQIAQVDPQADIRFALSCPSCNYQWQTIFDIVSYLWSEVDTWAHRLLREIHVLASAYGWREADILALSPRRRAYYLGLVEG